MHLSAMDQSPIASVRTLGAHSAHETSLQPGAHGHRVLSHSGRAIANREGGAQSTTMNTFGFLALAAMALAGCSTSSQQSTCEPMVAQICSSAVEAQLHDGTLTVGYSSRPREARVVPFVVPVFRRDGALATEVDCYANTDSHTYSIVRSDLAIPPESQKSIDFLRDRHLYADEGSYAEDERSRIETASALPPILR
jgi:hypothetical protein